MSRTKVPQYVTQALYAVLGARDAFRAAATAYRTTRDAGDSAAATVRATEMNAAYEVWCKACSDNATALADFIRLEFGLRKQRAADMPFSPDEAAAPPPIVPSAIRCGQHGERCRVTEQRILTHTDGTQHVYAFAVCGKGSLPKHEFGEHVRKAG